ncbi:hypothetical protein I6N95_05065 [Vagococcus sp. BWB3-3]|uniref:Uncharacterized protein n=1 Tax=Vagococcus allomyrinae TaxID=2794353 RepID=A0A940STK3_9ENTE|nr:hypothetical protein [Vagococcus allomyrinae]MBP1040380.1 hypothetical protein [Vagococcus allomyrinae]
MNDKQKRKLLKKHIDNNPTEVINEYRDVLTASGDVINMQSECIKKGIAMRIFNQEVIELLVKINKTGNLTPTIDAMTQLACEFDTLAMEYGPYTKQAYIQAVVTHSSLGGGNNG